MSEYYEALNTCDQVIFDLWGAINDYLPDHNGEYIIAWDLSECEYIRNSIHAAADAVLSTMMANHVSYEVHTAIDSYDAAFKQKDIAGCKAALMKCCKVFRDIRIVCQRVKSDMKKKGVA